MASKDKGKKEPEKPSTLKIGYACQPTFNIEVPKVPLGPRYLNTSNTDAQKLLQTEMSEMLAFCELTPTCTDFFAGCGIDFGDSGYYAFPAELGVKIVDPEDACLINADLLDEVRTNSSLNVSIPSNELIAKSAENFASMASEFKAERLVSSGVIKKVLHFNKPVKVANASDRKLATLEALHSNALNFLQKPEYSEDRVAKLEAGNTTKERQAQRKILQKQTRAQDLDETSPLEYTLNSFAEMQKRPLHPKELSGKAGFDVSSLGEPVVTPILPHMVDGLMMSLKYTRAEDCVTGKYDANDLLGCAKQALDVILIQAHGSKGSYNQFRPKRQRMTVPANRDIDDAARELIENEETDNVMLWTRLMADAPTPAVAQDEALYMVRTKDRALIGQFDLQKSVRRKIPTAHDNCERIIAAQPAVVTKKANVK